MKKLYLTVLLLTLTACSSTISTQSEPNVTSTPPQSGSTTKSLTPSPATTLPINTSIPSPSPASSSPSPSEPPTILVSATPAATVQDVRVEAADGLVITGTFHPASNPPPWSVVLLLHMVYGDRSQWDELVPLLTSNGYAVVVLLSPGLNYFGVTTSDALEAYGKRPILIAASSEDTNSADSSQELVKTALGESKLLTYDGAGHGTAMLQNEPELQKIILGWLNQYLK